MALTITLPQLAAAVRVQDSPTASLTEPYLSIMARQRAVAEATIESYAVDTTPDDVKNEAAVLMVGYLLDAPPVPAPGSGPSAAFINSGARAILSPWHEPAVEKVT